MDQKLIFKHFGSLVGEHPLMIKMYRFIEKASLVNVPILLVGETGTGKELVARAIHDGAHLPGNFVPLNTGGLSNELINSELFGHKRGAFTGAVDRSEGLFHEAQDGTLFLDEISSMNHMTQISLLRVLEYGKYRMVGGMNEIRTEARVIAAINHFPEEAVMNGELREDLIQRLQVFKILVPSLRERCSDIEVLSSFFVQFFSKEFRIDTREIRDDALDLLQKFNWPGNVRELKNVIAQALIVGEEGAITSRNIPPRIRNYSQTGQDKINKRIQSSNTEKLKRNTEIQENVKEETENLVFSLDNTLDEVQKIYVNEILRKCGYNKSRAAKLLGISRKALYDKLSKWEIE